MDDFLLQLPKAELHLHLEGSVEPETLHELDPARPVEEFRALYRYDDFDAFLRAFGAVGKRLRTPRDYGLIARRVLERLAAQNVRYAEIIVAAGVVLWKGQEFGPIFERVREAAAGSPVEVRWILDAVRQFGVEHAMAVAKLAAERVDRQVVAFGIGGSEQRGPAEWFTQVFSFAKSAGLHLTAHAGETMGPESVWAALRLGAERIGHGIAAVRDQELMRHLRAHDIPLEICLTSNLVTGVVRPPAAGGARAGGPPLRVQPARVAKNRGERMEVSIWPGTLRDLEEMSVKWMTRRAHGPPSIGPASR